MDWKTKIGNLLTAFRNKHGVLVASYKSSDGNNWYRKYSDGWIEQGGLTQYTGSSNTTMFWVGFSLAFSDIKYFAIQTKGNPTDTTGGAGTSADFNKMQVYGKTTTGFYTAAWTPTGGYPSGSYVTWYACGY